MLGKRPELDPRQMHGQLLVLRQDAFDARHFLKFSETLEAAVRRLAQGLDQHFLGFHDGKDVASLCFNGSDDVAIEKLGAVRFPQDGNFIGFAANAVTVGKLPSFGLDGLTNDFRTARRQVPSAGCRAWDILSAISLADLPARDWAVIPDSTGGSVPVLSASRTLYKFPAVWAVLAMRCVAAAAPPRPVLA